VTGPSPTMTPGGGAAGGSIQLRQEVVLQRYEIVTANSA
jgi:hypothetical protein